MLKHQRKRLLLLVLAVSALSMGLLATSDTSYRVDLSSVVELWSDVVKGVDKFGLTITTVSVEKEIALGDEIAAQGFPPLHHPSLEVYVEEVGSRIAENVRRKRIPYRFHLIDTDEVNAYAVAGGHIYLTSGMLGHLESEAELAYILGHEIAHVDLKHSVGMLQYELFLRRVAGGMIAGIAGLAHHLIRLGYSEQQELEADRTGLLLMARAGYLPIDGLEINARLQSLLDPKTAAATKPKLITQELGRATGKAAGEYFATHPSFGDRLGHLERLIDANAVAWKGKEFCVGRSNLRLRTPCFIFKPLSENSTFGSDAYHLRLGLIADRLGDPLRAKQHLLRAFEIKPALAEEHWLTAMQLIAGGEHERAIGEIELAKRLWLFELEHSNEFGRDRQSELREAFVAHVEILRKLNRTDFPLLPAALAYPGFDNSQLCRLMLPPPAEEFDARQALAAAGAEAARRKLSINDCRIELALPKLPAVWFVDDRRICRSALDQARAEWDSSATWKEFVDEAFRRKLSVRDCRVALGLPFVGLSDEGVCAYAVNITNNDWSSHEVAVQEARQRGFTVESCRVAIGLPRAETGPFTANPPQFSYVSDDILCRRALSYDRMSWDRAMRSAVAEVARRKFSINDCRIVLGLPSLSP